MGLYHGSSIVLATEAPAPGAAPPPDPAHPRWGLLRNLRGGLRLLLLRRVAPETFVRSFDQLLALGLINVLLWVGLETLHAEADALLGLDAFYGLGCYVLIGLLACALIARLHSAETDTRALLVPLFSVAPCVLVLFWLGADLASHSDEAATVALLVGLIYLAALGLRVLRAAFGTVHLAPALAAVLLVVASPMLLDALNLDTRLWVASDDSADTDSDDSTTEPLLYDQPARIEAAVQRVAPPRTATPSVYFVGFAGDGDQGIFKREALFAEQVFAAHFGSGPRSVQLINDAQDRDTYPLATLTGLEQVLKRLASRMDPASDVLVLALTSHGSEEGLAVSNGSLPLLPLAPADLRAALDKSGIKWRVVLVSACYSGVFLDALKSDTSLVITAADSGHSSFGCEEDRELTYFGEAFLKSSVPTTDSLEQAFRKAASLIDARETAEHKPHSNPQMYLGPLMRQKLPSVEAAGSRKDSRFLTVNAGK